MASRAFVQIAGEAARIETSAFRRAVESAPGLRLLLSRYALAFINQLAQSGACYRSHSVEERCACWLLMTHDRVDDETRDDRAVRIGADDLLRDEFLDHDDQAVGGEGRLLLAAEQTPDLGVASGGGALGMDDGDVGPSGNHGVGVQFLEPGPPIEKPAPRNHLEPLQDLDRERTAVGLHVPNHNVGAPPPAPLSFGQQDVVLRGHAIECRINAEDVANGFLPAPGLITAYREPAGPGVRVDSGVQAGDEVSGLYDPMIAKLAVWGRTRSEAIDRLRRALDEYEVSGITTTLSFFREVIRDEEFISGRLDTGFISRFNERREVQPASEVEEDLAMIAAALSYATRQQQTAIQLATKTSQSRWRRAARSGGMVEAKG